MGVWREVGPRLGPLSLLGVAAATALRPSNPRQLEKLILDNILGSKAYDPRMRPAGVNSTAKLREKFCQRGTENWSWKMCESAKSGLTNTEDATLVSVNIFVRGFSKIDDVKME